MCRRRERKEDEDGEKKRGNERKNALVERAGERGRDRVKVCA